MDLSDKRDLRWFSDIVRDLHAAAPTHEPLLVGAMARDLLLHLNKDNSERLYDEAPQLLDSDDFDYDAAGAWLAGYDAVRSIDSASPEPATLRDRVLEILSREVDLESRLWLVGEAGAHAAAALRLLRGFHDGFYAGRGLSK